jgi:hypothetical protein
LCSGELRETRVMSLPNFVDFNFESFEIGFTAIVVSPNETLKKSAPWCVIIIRTVYTKKMLNSNLT